MTIRPQTHAVPVAPIAADPPPVDDLLLDAAQVVARLRRAVSVGDWTDAYLFAAGLSQLVDDDLHPDPGSLGRAAAFLKSRGSPAGAVSAAMARTAARAVAPIYHMGRRRQLQALRMPLRSLVDALAAMIVDPATTPGTAERVSLLLDRSVAVTDVLREDVLRLPAAFRDFDLHPDDIDRLAAETLDASLRPVVPVCVVGVRTSGSYLAPLFAAALRCRGVPHVEVLTHRPHRAFLSDEVDQLQRVCGGRGRIVIVDDPPGSGTSLAATASAVARTGIADDAIVVAACLFPDAGPTPEPLARWATVTLPWTEWSVHERLSERAVADTLNGFVNPRLHVDALRRTSEPTASRKTHVRAQYVMTVHRADGLREDREIVVEGAGLGWLGRHAIAVTDAMYGWTPHAYGIADGLLYRAAAGVQAPSADTSTASRIAAYCAERHDALPARRDPTRRMRGRDPAWEVAASVLSGMFGRLGPLARPLLLEPLTRRLLHVDEPSVVDGDTDLRRWRVDPDKGHLVKPTAYERAFSHLEAACYDPLFDLAGAAADAPIHEFEALLRREYERISGAAVPAEPWLLYRLVHLWRMGRAGDVDAATVARGSAVAVTQYLVGIHLADLGSPTGPLCALDLDGVLESDPLGFPATTPTAAHALRALITHGYRPVPVTGRSVADVRDLCTVLGLPGGVAEYGTVAYVRDGDRIVDLRSNEQRALVDDLRTDLAAHPGIDVDPGHRYAIRARSKGGPLAPAQLALTVRDRSAGVSFIHGQAQTDVTVAGLDKATGLDALGLLLGGDTTCALAVGDGPADVAVIANAVIGRAPANAAREVRAAGIIITRRAYQAGVSDAVAELLAHRPGGCATCRLPRPAAPTAATLAVLALRENGVGGLASRAVRLAAATTRLAVTSRW